MQLQKQWFLTEKLEKNMNLNIDRKTITVAIFRHVWSFLESLCISRNKTEIFDSNTLPYKDISKTRFMKEVNPIKRKTKDFE